LTSKKWGTFGRYGEGTCNLVYVTDVVQAIYRALTAENGVGDAFNINGGEIITWNDYFVRFNEVLGLPPLRAIDARSIAVKARLLSPVREVGRFALSRFGSSLTRIHSKSPLAARYMKSTESSLKLTPTPEQLKLYGVEAEYVIDKARHQLGYEPKVGISQGLDCCARWLRHHELLY
jgi:nucleoside-diphosphate-sugar epimerase